MAILSPMSQQGPYIPFEKPIATPTSLADDDPLSHICFNSEWLSPVLGALKVLCRPETWEGTDADIRSTIASAHDLLAAYASGCDILPQHLNWYLDLSAATCSYDFDVWSNPLVGIYGDGTPWAMYTLVGWGCGEGGDQFTIIGRDWDTGDPVGGQFDDVTIINELDPAGQTYVLTTLDCLDNTVVHSDFTPRSYSGQMKSWDFVTGNVTMYIMKFLISGDWLCSAA